MKVANQLTLPWGDFLIIQRGPSVITRGPNIRKNQKDGFMRRIWAKDSSIFIDLILLFE